MRHRLAALTVIGSLACALAAEGSHLVAVAQKGRAFSVSTLTVVKGDTVRFTNEDGFLHQIFVHSPGFSVDSDEQRPGENVDVQFTVAGNFRVLCAIHPKMTLAVEVK